MNSQFEILHRAVCALAERNADQATEKNDIGYNGSDTSFGNSIAGIPLEQWTPGELHRVSRMLKKYTNQLIRYGIDITAAPEPPEASYIPRTNRYIQAVDYVFIITFKYNAGIVMDVRCLPGAKYNGADKLWTVPVAIAAWNLIKALIRDWDFETSDRANELLDRLEGGWEPEPLRPEVVIVDAPVIVPPEPMKQIAYQNRKLVVKFDYNPALVAAVKEIPGRKFDGGSKVWTVPVTKDTAEALAQFADIHGFTIEEAARKLMQEIVEVQAANLAGSTAEVSDFEVEGLSGTLRPFQKAGVEYLTRVKRGFNCDDMGLGKTIQTIATIHHLNAYPAIIIAPATMKRVWQREWKKWVPGKSVSVWDGTGYALTDVVIVNYDILTKILGKLSMLNAKAVAMDEFHYCKNKKAARTKACLELCAGKEVVLGLTGTPVLNRPSELIAQLEILDQLDKFGGFWHFATHYCQAERNAYGLDMSGADHLDELNEKLRATCMIRRRKADVLKELPALQNAVVPVEITNWAEYQAAERNVIEHIRELAKSNRKFHAQISHLSPEMKKEAIFQRGEDAAYKAAKAEQLTRIEALKQVALKGKWDAIKKWGADMVESGEKVIWFGWHIDAVNQLAAEFNANAITGATDLDDRQAYVDDFQTNPDRKAIAMNIQAGGVGITLTAASNVVFTEFPWNPAAMDQASARAHRMGQENPVTAWSIVGVGTIDEDIIELIDAKRLVTEAIMDGKALPSADFDIMDALIDRLANRNQ